MHALSSLIRRGGIWEQWTDCKTVCCLSHHSPLFLLYASIPSVFFFFYFLISTQQTKIFSLSFGWPLFSLPLHSHCSVLSLFCFQRVSLFCSDKAASSVNYCNCIGRIPCPYLHCSTVSGMERACIIEYCLTCPVHCLHAENKTFICSV